MRGGGGGYRTKNKNPTRQCGEKLQNKLYMFFAHYCKKRQSKLKFSMIIKCDPKIFRSQIHYNTEICQVIDVCEGVISFFAVSVLRMVSESQRLWPLEPRQLKPSCKTFTPSMSNTSQEPPRALPLALHGIWSRKHAFPFSAHRPSKTTSAKVRRWHSRCSPCLIPNDLPLSLSRSRTGWNVGRTRCPNWILQTY